MSIKILYIDWLLCLFTVNKLFYETWVLEAILRFQLLNPLETAIFSRFLLSLFSTFTSGHHTSHSFTIYHKTPKNSDTSKNYCNYPKIWLIWILHRVKRLNDADRMANSVDPDQTASTFVYPITTVMVKPEPSTYSVKCLYSMSQSCSYL